MSVVQPAGVLRALVVVQHLGELEGPCSGPPRRSSPCRPANRVCGPRKRPGLQVQLHLPGADVLVDDRRAAASISKSWQTGHWRSMNIVHRDRRLRVAERRGPFCGMPLKRLCDLGCARAARLPSSRFRRGQAMSLGDDPEPPLPPPLLRTTARTMAIDDRRGRRRRRSRVRAATPGARERRRRPSSARAAAPPPPRCCLCCLALLPLGIGGKGSRVPRTLRSTARTKNPMRRRKAGEGERRDRDVAEQSLIQLIAAAAGHGSSTRAAR